MHRAAAQPAASSNHRLRFELILGSLLLGFGLFALPALIFWVGTALLGPYGTDGTVGMFYSDFYGHLATGSGRAWTLVLGPLVMVSLLRLLFLRRPAPTDEPAPPRQMPEASENRRVEPRISSLD